MKEQFFEQIFVQILANGDIVAEPQYAGRRCCGKLKNDLRLQLQFEPGPASYMYDALSVKIMNQASGVIGETSLSFYDYFTRKQVNHPNFPDGVLPIIISKTDKVSWYGAYIEPEDLERLYKTISDYCSMALEQGQNTEQDRSQGQTL